MSTNYNKNKFIFLSTAKIIKYLVTSLFFLLFIFFIYDELNSKKRYKNILQEFSEKYNYQLEFYVINTVFRAETLQISKIINKYIGQSIFLIPLTEISDEILNLKWVKGVNLSTNLKDKIIIEILEYEPIGLYLFNNQIFYFSKEGKIIDKIRIKQSEKFTIFSGKNALNHALHLLEIIDKIKHPELINIREAYYINNRRWNLKFSNEIIVFLSEKNIESALINYIKLIEQLRKAEIFSIKSIDLRNGKKAIINFK